MPARDLRLLPMSHIFGAASLSLDPALDARQSLGVPSCCGGASASREPPALKELLAQRGELVAFARRHVADAALAEELVQAAFARAAERIDQLEDPSAARAWFYRLLRNMIQDHRRRRGARDRALSRYVDEQELAVAAAERQARPCLCVATAMTTLKPEYQDALRHIDIEGMAVKDYGELVHISANNAAVRVFRARQALKSAVEARCGACAENGGCFDCACDATTASA